jgi:hypothetical protein
VHPGLLEAVKESPRDPLNGMERPRGKKRLSTAEVALLEFLSRGGKRSRRRKPKPEERSISAQAASEQAAGRQQAAEAAA